MKIKTARALMTFAIWEEETDTQYMRHFTHEGPKSAVWLKRVGENMLAVTKEEAAQLEATFNVWCKEEKARTIEQMKAQGYQVVEVDDLSQLDPSAYDSDGHTLQ